MASKALHRPLHPLCLIEADMTSEAMPATALKIKSSCLLGSSNFGHKRGISSKKYFMNGSIIMLILSIYLSG